MTFQFRRRRGNGTLTELKQMGYGVINLRSDRTVVIMDVIRLAEEWAKEKA